jgi:hypothetical protein
MHGFFVFWFVSVAKIQKNTEIAMFFLKKILVFKKIVLPLHPLNSQWRGSSAG